MTRPDEGTRVSTRPTDAPVDVPTGRQARRSIARLLVALDLGAAVLAVVLGGIAREVINPLTIEQVQIEPVLAIVLVPALLAGLAAVGCYRPAGASLGSDTFSRYARGVGLDVLVIGFVVFALRLQPSRLYVFFVAVLLLTFGMLARVLARRWLRSSDRQLASRVLVIGADEASQRLASAIDTGAPGGYEVIGLVSMDDDAGSERATDMATLGRLDDVPRLLAETRPDAVIASTSSLRTADLRELYVMLEPTDVELVIHPSLIEVAARRIDVETAGSLPLLHLSKVRLTAGKRIAKRTLDLVVAGTLTVLLAPLIGVLAVAIRLDSPGPAVFRQTRVGHRGELFEIWKLRSMTIDAPSQRAALEDDNDVGTGMFKLRDDPRVTRVGGVLRRFSLDELPQLWNVLRGEMSMVGPRPLPLEDALIRHDDAGRRLRLMPGLSGLWQVSGRSDLDADEALRLDLFYVENWSLAFDLQILARTVRAVLAKDGAY